MDETTLIKARLAQLQSLDRKHDLGLATLLPTLSARQQRMALEMVEDYLDDQGAAWTTKHASKLRQEIAERARW